MDFPRACPCEGGLLLSQAGALPLHLNEDLSPDKVWGLGACFILGEVVQVSLGAFSCLNVAL